MTLKPIVSTRQSCRTLRERGHSIGDIAQKLRLSESTVHWHVKDIQLTEAQRRKLRERKRVLMAQVNARRRGIPLKMIRFRKPQWSSALVHLVAHLSFDGRIDRFGCHYYNRSYQQIHHVRSSLSRLLNVAAKIRRRPNDIWVLNYYNVAVANWLQTKEQELLHVISHRPRWQQQWLQALFDDEGHVHLSGSTRRVRASQDNTMVLRHARRFLSAMRIGSRIDSRARAIEITGRENLLSFSQRINFSPGIAINEHRKNGLWSQPMEKRQLLHMALSSYESLSAL